VSLQCQQQSLAECCSVANGDYDSRVGRTKPDRPVVLPNLAKYLIGLRNLKRWKQSQAASMAARRKLPVSYTAIRWLEEGKNQNPEPELLKGLADLYDTSYEDLAARFIDERYGLHPKSNDLVRHGREEGSETSPGGSPDVPASARRIAELQARIDSYEIELGSMQDVAGSGSV